MLMIFSVNNIFSQKISVPIDVQLELVPKILTLNKNFTNLIKKPDIHIGIIFSSLVKSSASIKDKIMKYVSDKKIFVRDKRLIFIPLDIAKIKDLQKQFQRDDLQSIYITPLRAYNIEIISKICKEEKIISFSSVSDYLKDKISIGFELVNSKVKIAINISSAKEEGANFSSHLLKIAEIRG